MQKKCGRYLRFSQEDQSANSTERQDTVTYSWCERSNVEIIATFTDDGYSARTFDRPDVKELFKFIERNNKHIDYLVVQDLSRFSRDAGEAITMVKNIQLQYGVRIVSCEWNQVYDVTESNSFFMMCIEFGRATAENLNRISYTRGGLYAAKTGISGKRTGDERGRYVGSRAPFGYKKIIENKLCNIAIAEELRPVIQKIYADYLAGIPVIEIKRYAKSFGFKGLGKCAIQQLIANPVYKGEQYVKPFKHYEGGYFRGSWEPIIDAITWQRANEKLKGNKFKGHTMSDKYYLKGVARCFCGAKLTGADSKGKTRYYPYYKCNTSGHVNINADYAHSQMTALLQHLSLPDHLAVAIKEASIEKMEVEFENNKKLLSRYKIQLAGSKERLLKVEEKFINDQLTAEAYKRWTAQYSNEVLQLQHQIESVDRSDDEMRLLLHNNLERLTDIPFLLSGADGTQRERFLNMVFDNGLYIKDKIYRTPYLMDIFHHNKLILNQKKLLIIDEKRASVKKPDEGCPTGPLSNPILSLLSIVESIKVA